MGFEYDGRAALTLRRAALASSVITLVAVTSGQAMAQSSPQTLPQVNVDAPKAAAKAKPAVQPAPRKVVKPKPQPAAEPVAEVAAEPAPASETVETAKTGEARDAAIQNRVYSTPAAVSSVGSSEIAKFGAVDMGDVLRSIPGTSVRESPNNPGVAVNIRGFEGSGRVNAMIDGVRQNFRFTGHEAQGFVYVDQSLLAGVDIARGAVSTAGGAGALAGAANFRTLEIIDVLKPGRSSGALLTTSYGTNGQGWSGMAAGAMTNGAVGFVGAISGRNPDNFENGAGKTVPYTGQDLQSGLLKGEFKLTDEHKVKIGGVFYRNDFLANSYNQTIESDIVSLNYNYKPLSTELINLKINASRSDVTMVYGQPNVVSIFTPNAGRTINDVGTGFDITNISSMRFGDLKVRSEYGYEYFHDDVDTINSTKTPGFGVNPTGESSISGAFSSTIFSYVLFDLTTGLRYDRFTLEGSSTVRAGNPLGLAAGQYDVDRDEGRLNPKVTLAASVTPWFQPYVTYAEAMRAPTVNEALIGGSHPGTTTSFLPNPFIEPEIQKGWELGFNTSIDRLRSARDVLNFKAGYFHQNIENYIVGTFTSTNIQYFVNTPGTSKVEGIELQGMYDAGIVFAGLSYTWTETDLPAQTNGLGAQSFMPDHVLSVSGGVRLLDERWTLGARGYYASDAFVGVQNVAAGLSPYTDGYTLLDLFTSYKLTPDVEIGATMTNVLDVAYTPATSTPATGFTGDTGRGRTTLFTARAKF